jgi:hypothetical protein
MSDGNGDALGAFKANVEEMAYAQLALLNDEASSLEARLSEVRKQRKQVRAVLLATSPKPPRERKKSAPKAGVPFKMSAERRAAFQQFLDEHGQQEFTTRTVKDAFPGWADSYANMTVKLLREEGVIRKAAQSGSTSIYKAVA